MASLFYVELGLGLELDGWCIVQEATNAQHVILITLCLKYDTALACYNFDERRTILIFLAEMLLKSKQSSGTLFSHFT